MLTNKELRKLQAQHPTENDPMPFARAVIAAYEAKLHSDQLERTKLIRSSVEAKMREENKTMSEILSNKEIARVVHNMDCAEVRPSDIKFARAIESAVLAKLRDQKPLGKVELVTEEGKTVVDAYGHPAPEGEQSPTAWFYHDNEGYAQVLESGAHPTFESTPLYKHPAPIPEGYALIPVAPTDAILKAIASSTFLEQCYANILAAARSGE